jgi:hypothetical protein
MIPANIDPELLRKYVKMREAVRLRGSQIENLTYLLSLLDHCDKDTIPVSPKVLASFADEINSDITFIQEELDEFIYIMDAEKALNS